MPFLLASPCPNFFGPFSPTAFLVNEKSLFLQKCHCFELWTVFRLLGKPPFLKSSYVVLALKCCLCQCFWRFKKSEQTCPNWGRGGEFGQSLKKKHSFSLGPFPKEESAKTPREEQFLLIFKQTRQQVRLISM